MKYDLIIIGGGMVGASLAYALHESSLNIALVDATPLAPKEDPRLIALTYASICLFKNLNLWAALSEHACAINEVHVSKQNHFGTTRLKAAECNLPALGFLVPAKYINAVLYDALAKTNIDILRPATLKNFSQEELTIEIEGNEKTLTGKIIVGADGTHSTVRELLNIPTKKIDYEQSAIVTTTELQRHHHHIAYERFTKTGAIAMLPLSDNQCATIWTDQNDRIASLLSLTDEAFLQTLQTTFGYRLGRFKKIGKRFTYPLQFIHASEQIKKNSILIGNAAHTVSPIAAQGFNVALHEIAFLVDEILAQNPETLSLNHLQNNFLALQKQQQFNIHLSHYLTEFFATDIFPVSISRKLGMLGLDIFPSLKHFFANKVMGRNEKLPRLLQCTAT